MIINLKKLVKQKLFIELYGNYKLCKLILFIEKYRCNLFYINRHLFIGIYSNSLQVHDILQHILVAGQFFVYLQPNQFFSGKTYFGLYNFFNDSLIFFDKICQQYCISIIIDQNNQCKQKDKQLALMQAELNFQIKKLNEDMAHQKLTLQMNHQRETKKLNDKANYAKNQRQLQNQIWIKKHDTMAQLYHEKLKNAEEEYCQKIDEIKNNLTKKEYIKCEEIEQQWKKELTLMKQQNQEKSKNLLLVKEDQKKNLIKNHQEQINKINQKHTQELNNLKEENQRREEIILNYHQSQRNHQNAKCKNQQQIVHQKQEISSLKQKIQKLQNTIHYLQYSCLNQSKIIEQNQSKHSYLIKKMKQEFQNQTDKNHQEFNSRIAQLIDKEYKRCQQYQHKLAQLNQLRQKQLKFYQQSLNDLRCFSQEKCVPKTQFHQEISTLQVRLTSKDQDIEKAKEQIKQCKLQIQNNDQILTKFFRSSNHQTAPDIFIHTPQNKKKDYKIKKNRSSMGTSFLDVGLKSSTKVSSMQSLEKNCQFQSIRMI